MTPKNLLRNQTFTHVLIMALAATAAYLIALTTTFINPTIATLIAIISVKQTLHETLQETTYQMGGTILGVGLSLIISEYTGFQWWTIPLFIAVSFTIATVLKIGIRGGTIISITTIFITAPFIDETITSQQRMFGVGLGILTAAAAALIPIKEQPQITLTRNIADTRSNLHTLLNSIAAKLTTGDIDKQTLTQWIIEAETERNKIREYNQTFTQLEKTKHWSPTLTNKTLTQLKEQLSYTTRKALATKNITHILEDITNLKNPPRKAIMKIGKIIQQTTSNSIDTGAIDTISKETLEDISDTQAIILTSTLYSEAQKLKKNKKKPEL
jgi:uncharacterized membrane protein YgaE (UPF0421/DUF939 family)